MVMAQNQLAFKQMFLIEKCRAQKGCNHAQGDINIIGEKVEKSLQEIDLTNRLRNRIKGPVRFHHLLKIAISGCTNGCAQPQIRDIGIIMTGHPKIDASGCSGCGSCIAACKESALLENEEGIPRVDHDLCLACGDCILECPLGVISYRKKGYRLLVGGKLGRHPVLAREWGEFFDSEQLLKEIKHLLHAYLEEAEGEEKLANWLERREYQPRI